MLPPGIHYIVTLLLEKFVTRPDEGIIKKVWDILDGTWAFTANCAVSLVAAVFFVSFLLPEKQLKDDDSDDSGMTRETIFRHLCFVFFDETPNDLKRTAIENDTLYDGTERTAKRPNRLVSGGNVSGARN